MKFKIFIVLIYQLLNIVLINCENECVYNDDCPTNKDCVRNKCIDSCMGICGENAECRVVKHNPICSCIKDYIGNPYAGCIPSFIARIKQRPIDPCFNNSCGPNARCHALNEAATCACLEGYIGTPPSCRLECTIDAECANTLACINNKCRDPCPGTCGKNAECYVLNHNPVCKCLADFTGDPFIVCTRQTTGLIDPCQASSCGSNAVATISGKNCICTCNQDYFGDPFTGCRPATKVECTSDSECPVHLACIQEKCQNPCFNTKCGINTDCKASNHRAVCVCREGYAGDPYNICKEPRCKSDLDCPLTQTCLNDECVDPCPLERCGVNALCLAKNHRAVCSCPPGYRPDPDPYIRCKQFECLTDPECPTTQACQNEQCVDPCKCARNADCSARNHTGICTCYSGYTGDPYGIACELIIEEDLGCQMDKDCPSKLACIISGGRGECKNPCTTFLPCVLNAECKVYDSLPLRTMTCTCNVGFTGKGDELCQKIAFPLPAGCSSDYECPSFQACLSRNCVNPCTTNPCGSSARCSVINHRATCSCPPEFAGDPYLHCSPDKVGRCYNDSECPDNKACNQPDCVNPCANGIACGKSAVCTPIGHRAVCKCPTGWGGDPSTECYQYECLTNNDCPLNKACILKECIDPCKSTVCGSRALCKAEYHTPICYCPPGLQGNERVACIKVKCTTNADCANNEKCDYPRGGKRKECVPLCVEPKCVVGAICSANNHKEECFCKLPLKGDGYVMCPGPFEEPECLVDQDCPSKLACISQSCQNPCTINNPCQFDQQCFAIDSQPSRSVACVCPEGTVLDKNGNCTKVEAQPQCYTNSECLNSEVCNQGSCLDACRLTVCGSNARCSSSNHTATCQCPHGYEGNPQSACYALTPSSEVNLPGGCSNDSECPDHTTCENMFCINPCAFKNPCAPTANCQAINHQAVCSCPDGYKGSPTTTCILAHCKSDSDCPLTQTCVQQECADTCSMEICGVNALCSVKNHSVSCSCPSGYRPDPDPYIRCKPYECLSHPECPTTLACENEQCVDPCKGNCARNADCSVIKHREICRCHPGYQGDPYGIACSPIPGPL